MYNKLKNIIPNRIKIDSYSARLLNVDDIQLVQKFYENNENFFIITQGKKPDKNLAENDFKELPEGKVIDDKFWIGLFDKDVLIGFVDMIQNYKEIGEWTIDIYLIDKNYRGLGIATKLLNSLENILISLKANSLRIIVQEQNKCGLSFWNKMNFIEVEKVKQKFFKDKENIIMIKKLERKEPSIEEKFFKNGKLINFPSKPTEQKEVYKLMKNWFKENEEYTEPQINEIIKSKIECKDHSTIRRDLVDNGILKRSDNGSKYWI